MEESVKARRELRRSNGLCVQCGSNPIYRASLCSMHYEQNRQDRIRRYRADKLLIRREFVATVVTLDLERDGPFCTREGCPIIALHKEHG